MKLDTEKVIEKYKDRIFAIGLSILKNPDDADDVVQETFLKYHTYKKDFESKEHIQSWLYKVAINKAKDILHKMNIHENVGLIVSGDQFIAQEGQVSKIKKDFPNALCSEMEASAIGHTCYKFGVPFIITRSLSDVYGHGESSMQFDEYLKIASENSAKLCVELVKA